MAVDCMQLFSRMLMRDTRPPNSAQMVFHTTKEMTQAVMETPKLQPIFSVVYRFETAVNMPRMPPMMTARTVSCRMESPRPQYTRSYHWRSFSSGVPVKPATGSSKSVAPGLTGSGGMAGSCFTRANRGKTTGGWRAFFSRRWIGLVCPQIFLLPAKQGSSREMVAAKFCNIRDNEHDDAK